MTNMRDILKESWSAVREAELPDALQAVAFERAIDFFLRGGSAVEAPADAKGPTGGRGGTPDTGSDQPLQRIAQKLNVGLDRVKEVYAFDDSGLMPVVPVGKLDAGKSPAAKQIALLVAGGRQVGGIEEWTSSASIREVCEHYGKYDQANFASALKTMQDVFSSRGVGQKRQVRLNKVGEERLRTLVDGLASGGAS